MKFGQTVVWDDVKLIFHVIQQIFQMSNVDYCRKKNREILKPPEIVYFSKSTRTNFSSDWLQEDF